MKKKNNVTLVVGTYKKPKQIRPTIMSVLEQTYEDFHLYIVDDNHPDDIEIIKETQYVIDSFDDHRIKYVKNLTNIGVPFVFRKWINLVDTKYFMIMGDGDKLLPNALEKMVEFLDNHPSASMVHGLEINGDGIKGTPLFPESRIVDPRIYLESHLIGGKYSWSQAAAMFRTEFWKIKNIPVTHFHYWDHYFHCTYLLFSEKIGYLNEYMSIRSKEDSKFYDWVKENYFTTRVETIYQASKFIDEYEFFMIAHKYPVGKYRLKISKRILKQFLKVTKINEAALCLYIAFNYLFKILCLYIVALMLFPLNLLARIYLYLKKS